MGKKKNSDHAPFDNIFAPTVIKPKKTKRRPCSLTIVMAIFTALLVLSVASVTFAITYTTSLNTLRTVGRGYAESLASTASVRVTNVFESPASQLRAFGNSLKREGVHFPSEDVSGQAFMNETLLTLMPLFTTFPDVYNNMQLVWDDGSTMTLQRDNDTTIVRYIGVNSIEPRSALRLAFNSQTMRLAQTTTDFPDSSWRGATLYPQLRKTLYNADEGVWLPPAFVTINGPGVFALPASFPMRNRTNFMGTINADVAVTSMAEFLSTQKLTSEGNTFVLDGNLAILATSHTTPFVSTNVTTTYPTSLPANCAVAPTYGSGGSTYTVACRSLASTFSYPPLQRASDDAELVAPRTSSLVFKTLFSSDDTVYVVATRITNSLQNASVLFPVSLLLFVPEADVIGNIVGTRTTVIAIIAAVFVVASGVAAVVIHLVLRPLKDVAANMRNTAKLREVGDNIEMSQLKEVYDLQLAFRRMNAAIGSFTRYVPRDVVKDLMRSGQLCQIQMSKKTCSMLFVDIANFSLLCERVEADCLSSLVRVYFEQMSSIIANHEGVIDKYIGDCIMAVWGAVFGCPNQEVKAALCAFLMDRETHIAPLATRFAQANQTIGVRVGVATGTVLAGNMGSSERMTYTVIGDPVNLASKLEALNQHFDTRVLIDDTTAEKGVGVFCLRKVLKVSLGAQQHVTAYEVLGLLQEIRAEVMEDLRDRRSAFQREYDQTESMDSASSANASSMQSMTTFDTAETAAATLVDRARMLHSPPTVVDDATLEFARCYTEAVEHYVKADFKRCLEILATVHYATNVEPQCHRRLRQMAEDGARLDEPSLATFDGMWHLDEA